MDGYRQTLLGRALADALQDIEKELSGDNSDANTAVLEMDGDLLFSLFDEAMQLELLDKRCKDQEKPIKTWNGSMLSSTIKNSVRKAAVASTLTRGMAAAASSTKEVEEIGGFGQMTQPKLQLFGLHARYANALYSVAAKQNQLESVEKELLTIEETIAKEPNFASFLHDPTIARASKKEDIAKVMEKAKFSKPVAGLFEVLADNGRLPDAAGVISAFKKLMGAYRGEVQAKVTSADPLTKTQLDQVKKALGARVEKNEKLLLETVVDPEILGGLKVQIGNYFIDLSLATKIDKINTLLANSSQQ
ncbi:hypothetical protein PC129_g15667 [Phytophthora cactorum]|uniref:Uncharacterized protein n=1 Tax=Phytophthora cactorum TaxID=29920 RepID=A0A8T1CCU0_9STRA|nr:hypothetical protein PC117_g16614 [Phytophthora cactorum]KAG3213395.1 hypothetical protein PC129_g15667 [Phytophthora cactorum]